MIIAACFAFLAAMPARAQEPSPESSGDGDSSNTRDPPRLSPIFAQLPRRPAQSPGAIDESPPDKDEPSLPDQPLEEQTDSVSSRRFRDHPIQIETRLGVATTVGEAGVVGEYGLSEPIVVGMGIGMNTLGPEWGAHIRFRPISGPSRTGSRLNALTFESGFSMGRYAGMPSIDFGMLPCYEGDTSGCPTEHSAEWVAWLQFELGWETRAESGFSLRLSSGYAVALNTPNWQCTVLGKPVTCSASSVDRIIPTLTVAFGYAF